MYIWYGFQQWVWQNGSIVPSITFQKSVPRATFYVHYRRVTPLPTKKYLGTKSKTQQEVQEVDQFLQFPSLVLWWISPTVLIKSSSNLLSVFLRPLQWYNSKILSFRQGACPWRPGHGTGSFCNSGKQRPICPKLHTFDRSSVLNTYPCQFSVIVVASPTGNRKLHV